MTYSSNILEVKRKALNMGLCGSYKKRWDEAKDNKDLMSLATDINGADFVCSSIANRWGVGAAFIRDNFASLINDNHIHGHDGYNSAMYVKHNRTIECKVTILIVLFSKCTIHIPKGQYCHVFIAGEDTDVELICDGTVKIHKYNGNVTVKAMHSDVEFIDPKEDNHSWINF